VLVIHQPNNKIIFMNTVIFVPTISSSASWVFCNREAAFKNGVLNAAGKILSGYQNRQDAIGETLAKLPPEPFALLRLTISSDTQQFLANKGWMIGTNESAAGARLWTIAQAGCIYLAAPEKADLTMEIIAVPPQKIVLY
jgi:hypothetical protein